MWYRLGQWILAYRKGALALLLLVTVFMGWKASQVQLSYDFTRALPTDNPKYQAYQAFLKTFGNDGNTVVVGFETPRFFEKDFFNAVDRLQKQLQEIPGVTDVLSIPVALNLVNDTVAQQLKAEKIFYPPYAQQAALDSARAVFDNLPFYQSLLYNPQQNAYLLGIGVQKDSINSKYRSVIIANIQSALRTFEKEQSISVHTSGLPFIRTVVGDRIKDEMNGFLLGSLLLSALTLLLFFRSFSAMWMSLAVVLMGVIWSVGTLVLLGYKITLLTALVPPLVVVIGVPNCIYFLNKYHTAYHDKKDKHQALLTMVGRMGIVTLFCNIAAAIGFAVFALTKSQLLKEFGAVAGINIMLLFVVSLLFIPAVLSYLPPPQDKHTRYLHNPLLTKLLVQIERWAFHHRAWIYGTTALLLVLSAWGISKIKSEGFIVDDLPKNDQVYTDLKWFESRFGGVMPLEIVVDTQKKNGLFRNLQTITKISELSAFIEADQHTARPLSFVEGLKFAKQAFYDGDSLSYDIPYESDLAFMGPYLQTKGKGKKEASGMAKLLNNFIDSNKQKARISVNMQDVGSAQLPILLKKFEDKSAELFDSTKYKISFTGSSVSFLEGSGFIIRGLQESIFWAFLLITLCMLYLFRSLRILVCSLLPNLIPLVVTAGVMGWLGIALKPSTVLVFSVALGIVIDVTIRFLINYKQELPAHHGDVAATLVQTIRHTGISILYTSLVLIAGFVVFCFSDFGGTQALGWLTSLTLLVGTLTNLIVLPVLIISLSRNKK